MSDDEVRAIAHRGRAGERRPGEENDGERLNQGEDEQAVTGDEDGSVALDIGQVNSVMDLHASKSPGTHVKN